MGEKTPPMLPDEVRKAVEAMDLRFTSSNEISVERASIRDHEWAAIKAHLLAREADVERLQDSVNSLGLESAEHFVRGREWAERCGKQEARAERAEALLRDLLKPEAGLFPDLANRITAHLSENSRG